MDSMLLTRQIAFICVVRGRQGDVGRVVMLCRPYVPHHTVLIYLSR